jgi:hypothetical protein
MPIFGVTASSNMSTKLTDFFQIASTTVGAGGVADITFSSIPQTYTHLQIRMLTKTSVDQNVNIQFNSDTGNNYSRHYLFGNGVSAASSAVTSTNLILASYTSATADTFGAAITDILDYRNTNKFKTTKHLTGYDANGSGVVALYSGNWRNTNAITSIKIYTASGVLSQYSSFQLYGVIA